MPREACLAFTALLLGALTGFAQEPDSNRDILVFNYTFQSGSREFVRIFLMGGEVYRAEIDLGDISFSIRARDPGGQPPTVVPVRESEDGGAESVFEIYPFRDAEYEFQVLDVPSGETGKLTIYRDIRASERRRLALHGGPGSRWTMGLEVAAGRHATYQLSRFEEIMGAERSGTDYEGCLSLRSQGRLWGCLLGVTRHKSDSAASVLWFFVEPRFRLLGGIRGDPLEAGTMFRLGFGNAEEGQAGAAADHPAQIAPGLYLRYWIGREPGRGMSIDLAGRYAFLLGTDLEGATYSHFGIGVGYHF